MKSMEERKSGGIGFAGLLTITFIVLKLIGVVSWSWLWVLSPMWITWVLAIIVAIGIKTAVKMEGEHRWK